MDDGTGEGLVRELSEALRKAAHAAKIGVQLLALGTATLILGIIAAITAALGMLGHMIGRALSHVAHGIREALPRLLAAVPHLAEMLFLSTAIVAMAWCGIRLLGVYPSLWFAPTAAVVGIAPLVLLYGQQQSAGTAFMATVIAAAIGFIVVYLPLWLLGSLLVGVYGWLVLNTGKDSEYESEQEGVGGDSAGLDDPGAGGVDDPVYGDGI